MHEARVTVSKQHASEMGSHETIPHVDVPLQPYSEVPQHCHMCQVEWGAPCGEELSMRALIIREGFHQHGQPGGRAVQLAEVCQAGLAPFQLACQPLHIWQPCISYAQHWPQVKRICEQLQSRVQVWRSAGHIDLSH